MRGKREKYSSGQLIPGVKGILITTGTETEHKGKADIIDIFENVVNELYPELTEDEDIHPTTNSSESFDIAKQLQLELDEIKNDKKSKKKTLSFLETGCKGVLFLQIKNDKIDPGVLIHHLLKQIQKTKELKTR
eukprot:c30838_g1_i1.p1 GENE.c30838_g1_i1~~c30838_g1_i1.p1  ORF type:complete len:134 (+),score=45.89 c30838_g1_i1:23-424(+)